MFMNPICHWASSGDEPLLDFNPGELGPADQPFPADAAAFTALGIPTPVTIYGMEDAAGSGTVADAVGSADLATANPCLQAQKGVGLNDGTALSHKRVIEFEDNSNGSADAANATIHDFDATTSFCFFIIARQRVITAANRSLMQKRAHMTATGYYLRIWPPGSAVVWNIDAGPNISSSIGGFRGGGWHYLFCYCNRSDDTMQLRSDLGDGPQQSIAGYGSLSNVTTFSFGDGPENSAHVQIAYAALWTGANAESVIANWSAGSAYRDMLWTHGKDPTGLLTYIYHSSSIFSTPIGEDDNGLMIADWSGKSAPAGADGGQFPFMWHDAFSHAGKLGVCCNTGKAYRLTNSDSFASTWTEVNATVLYNWTNDLEDAPTGFHAAQRLTATANNGYTRQNGAVTAGNIYTIGVYYKRHRTMGANVNGALIAWDNIGGVQIGIQTFIGTDKWQVVFLTFTAPVGCTSVALRVRIDTSGEALAPFRAMFVDGPRWLPAFRWNGDVYGLSPAKNTMLITALAGVHMKGTQGEVKIHYVCFDDDAAVDRHAFSANPAQDRREVRVSTTEVPEATFYSGGGAPVGTTVSAVKNQSLEHVVRFRWDNANLLPCGKYTEVIVDGVSYPGHNAPWAATNATTEILIGAAYTYLKQLDGVIDYIKVYEFPQP